MGAAAAESMRSVEWSRIEAAASGVRRRRRVVTFAALFFSVYVFAPLLLALARGKEVTLLHLAFFGTPSLFFLTLAGWNELRLRREARLTAQGNTMGVLEVLRGELTRRIRVARGVRWVMLAYGLAGLAAPLYLDGPPLALTLACLVPPTIGFGSAYYLFRRYLPRLSRELHELA